MGRAPNGELRASALPRNDAVISFTLVTQAKSGVAIAVKADLRRNVGRPHHDNLVRIRYDFVQTDRFMFVFAPQRNALGHVGCEKFEGGSGTHIEHFVHE